MTTAPASSVASAAPATGLGAFLTQILSDRDRFFSEVVEGEGLHSKLVHALWTLIGLSALYGAAAGAYVDSSGARHAWTVSPSATLVWDGAPWIPTGVARSP